MQKSKTKQNPVIARERQVHNMRVQSETMIESFKKMSALNAENLRIMTRLVVTCEVLKDKGLYTDEEVKAKFEELEKAREERARNALETERARLVKEADAKYDKDSANPQDGGVQPQEPRSDEGNLGHAGLKVL